MSCPLLRAVPPQRDPQIRNVGPKFWPFDRECLENGKSQRYVSIRAKAKLCVIHWKKTATVLHIVLTVHPPPRTAGCSAALWRMTIYRIIMHIS